MGSRRGILRTLSLLAALAPQMAAGDVFNVAAGDTAGLVAAIQAANANGVTDQIVLATGIYELAAAAETIVDDENEVQHANGLPRITSRIELEGNGATVRRAAGALAFRIVHVDLGGTLVASDVTFSGGDASAGLSFGGGILVTGSNSELILNDSTVSDGFARWGGGIGVRGDFAGTPERLTLNRSTVSNSQAEVFGGGIYLAGGSGSQLRLNDSTVAGNTAGVGGGGILVDNVPDVILTRSLVSGNTVAPNEGIGGGIYIFGGTGTVTLTDTTVDGNTVQVDAAPFCGGSGSCFGIGGGIVDGAGVNVWLVQGSTISNNRVVATTPLAGGLGGGFDDEAGDNSITFINTTISGNSVSDVNAGITSTGGGLRLGGSTLGIVTEVQLSNVTIAENVAEAGGGVETEHPTFSVVRLRNTILARNQGGPSPDCFGDLESQGYNFIGSAAGCTIGGNSGGNLAGDPLLDPLADNGGPTWTHALWPISPALEAANPGVPGSGGDACEATDQRGLARPLPEGRLCDMGAFEFAGTGCDDGLDNDGDGKTDFPEDPGCLFLLSPKENPACDDGIDNDGDKKVDYPRDPECLARGWGIETSCGLGVELAPLLLGLQFLWRRRRARG